MKKLRDLYLVLQSEFPNDDGTKYGFDEKGAFLSPDWLLQTPNIWGMKMSDIQMHPLRDPKEPGIEPDFRLPVCTETTKNCNCKELKATVAKPGDKPQKLCLNHSTWFVDEFYSMIIQAEKTVYISTLIPGPNENFMAALRNAVTYLGHKGKPIVFHLLIGKSINWTGRAQQEADRLRNELTRDLKNTPGSKISLKVRVFGGPMGWNHSKILVVDENLALAGGHNYYHNNYLQNSPVFDLSMKLSGPAARFSKNFFNLSWDTYTQFPLRAEAVYPLSTDNNNGMNNDNLMSNDPPPHIADENISSSPAIKNKSDLIVPALGVGRLNGAWDTEPGERALLYLLENAQKSIKISQMSIGFYANIWPTKLMEAMAKFIVFKKKDIYIVQSDDYADGGYAPPASLYLLKGQLFLEAMRLPGRPPENEIKELFKKHLHLGTIHFSKDIEWPDKKGFGNHAKFLMVDDEQFYIGSQNMYITSPFQGVLPWLNEFGYIIESKEAAKQVLDQYWNNLWKYSEYWMTITTGKPAYSRGEIVDVWVKVSGPTLHDAIRFIDENGVEIWWTFTGENTRDGRITEKEYKIPDEQLPTEKKIKIEYLYEGFYEKIVMGTTFFDIRAVITVKITTDKPVYQPEETVVISWTIEDGVPHNDAIVIENKDGHILHSFSTAGITKYEWKPTEHGQEIRLRYFYDRSGKNWQMAEARFKVENAKMVVRTNKDHYIQNELVEIFVDASNNRKNDVVRLLDEKGGEIWKAPTGDIRSGKIAKAYRIEDTFLQKGQKITLQYLQYGQNVMGTSSFNILPMTVTIEAQYPIYQAGKFVNIVWKIENGREYIDDEIRITNNEGQTLYSFLARNGQHGWTIPAMSAQTISLTYFYNPGGKNWRMDNVLRINIENGITSVKSNKAEYIQNEKVEIYVEVAYGHNPQHDQVRFLNQKKEEIWRANTNGVTTGRIDATYVVWDDYLNTGQQIELQYLRGGKDVLATSTFIIKPMSVTITTDKPVYKDGEKVQVSVVVTNGAPYDDTIEFRMDGREDSFEYTNQQTNGPIPKPWGVRHWHKGKTIVLVYIYAHRNKKWEIATRGSFRVEA